VDLHSVFLVVWKAFEARVCTIASCCNDLSTVPEWQVSEFRVNRVWMECWSVNAMHCPWESWRFHFLRIRVKFR
jgi:hypothetical protein